MSSKVWFFLLVLIMATVVGCSGNEQVVPTTTPLPTSTPAPEVPPTEVVMPGLGEVQTIAYNGFSFRPVDGWELSTEEESVSMEAPDALETAGPGIFITGGYLEDFGIEPTGPVDATEAIIQNYMGAFIPVETSFMSEMRRVQVQGNVGNTLDFVVPEEAIPYRGRITVLQNGNQIFLMLGLTPPERWDNEFRGLYEEVLRGTEMVAIER
jgi:hypothetical protein